MAWFGRASGVHGGTDSGSLNSSINSARTELEKVATILKQIDASMASISSKSKTVVVPGSNSPGTANGGSVMATSLGQPSAVPAPAVGKSGQMTNPSNVSFGLMPSWALAGLGLAKIGGIAALGAGATAWAAMPETEASVAMQYGLHQMGTRQNNYMGKSTQTQLLNTIMGSMNTYAVGGRDQPMMAAMTLSGAGIQNQGMLRTLLSQNQGISMMTGLPNSNVAAAQAGLSSGPFAARALSFGIPVANISTGNMKGTQQILETMYNRMMVRENKASPELIQESFLRGALGANFRALGMSDEQQQIALQYFTERSRSNGPVNLSDVKGLQKMGYNEDNAAVMSEWSKSRSQLEVMNKTFDAMADASGDANRHLKMFYDTIADLPTDKLRKFAQAKGYLDTIMSDPATATGLTALGGVLTGITTLIGALMANRLLKSLLGLGGSPGGPGGTAARTGGVAARAGTFVTGAGSVLGGPMAAVAATALGVGAAGLRVALSDSTEDDRAWTKGWMDSPMGRQSQRGGGIRVGEGRSAPTGERHNPRIDNGGAAPLQSMNVSTAWHKPGSWSAGYHTGVDLSASIGTKVMSINAGRVVEASSGGRYGGAYGQHVVVKTGGREFLYAHLNSINVSRGDQVRDGQLLGKSGNTGRSFGPHLHFEVRKSPYNYKDDVDPMPYLKGKGALAGTAGGASGGALVEYAKKFIGTPYVAGGRDPRGWDCAGFTWFVAKKFGIEIGQVSEAQLKKGSPVNGVKNAKPGDLFIWRRKGTRGVGADGHVAMYVGGGRVIHAHGGAGGTTNITSLEAAVPSSHYLAGIRRIAGGSPGTGPALSSMLGSGTPEANGTTASGAVAGSLVDVTVNNAGMSVSTRTIADTFGAGAAGATVAEAGNGIVSRASGSDRSLGSAGQVTGGSNRAKVWNMLMEQGFTGAAAAGVLGNLMQESGVNPNSNQHGGGPGRGIMQWTVNERWASMQKWAKKGGLSARSLETQVQWMLKEMKDYGVFNKMRRMDDVEDATLYFENTMERAGVPNMASRYKYAREALKQFGKGSYSEGSYRVANDEDARVHAGEMILTAAQAEQVRKATAGVLSGSRGGGHTFNINVPAGTTEEQAQMIARRVASILDSRSSTSRLMEV